MATDLPSSEQRVCRSAARHPESYTAVFYLTAAFLFSATLLRSVLILGGDAEGGQALLLLAVWLVLFVVRTAALVAPPWLFGLCLLLQTALVVALLSLADSTDFFAVLFAISSMQVVQRWPLRWACVCIVLFVPLTALGIRGGLRPRRDARVRR